MPEDMHIGIDGYGTKVNGSPRLLRYRHMSVGEAQALRSGQGVCIADLPAKPGGLPELRRAKVNGKPKVWKSRPDDVRVPLKYGLYTYFQDCPSAEAPGAMSLLIVLAEGEYL